MSGGQRLLALGAILALIVGAFLIARAGGSDEDDDSARTTGISTAPAGAERRPARRPAPPPLPAIRIRRGKPVGGVGRLTVRRGSRVRFVVSSDVEDEVHLHGYDISGDVAPRRMARFDFRANIEGVFEVELERRGEQIASLRVRP